MVSDTFQCTAIEQETQFGRVRQTGRGAAQILSGFITCDTDRGRFVDPYDTVTK